MKTWIIGNWKMHGTRAFIHTWADTFRCPPDSNCAVAVCPPLPYLSFTRSVLSPTVLLGAQNVARDAADGAHTGEVSAAMLADNDCDLVVIGHSERRADNGESDADCAAKLQAAAAAGLRPVLCVGESDAARQNGQAEATVLAQLTHALTPSPDESLWRKLIVAYEPIWAIGSGKTPTTDDVAQMHNALRLRLSEKNAAFSGTIPLLYGGSVNPSNAGELFSVTNVNGFLVGGASLKPEQFTDICALVEQP